MGTGYAKDKQVACRGNAVSPFAIEHKIAEDLFN